MNRLVALIWRTGPGFVRLELLCACIATIYAYVYFKNQKQTGKAAMQEGGAIALPGHEKARPRPSATAAIPIRTLAAASSAADAVHGIARGRAPAGCRPMDVPGSAESTKPAG